MKWLLITLVSCASLLATGCANGNLNLRDASASVISEPSGNCRVQLTLTEPQASIVVPLPANVCGYIPPGTYTVAVDTVRTQEEDETPE